MKKIDIERMHGNIMRRSYNLELVNREAKDNLDALIATSEEIYRSQIRKVCSEIIEKAYPMVLLAGPSSSGKTTTSHLIRKCLTEQGINSIVVSLDDFFVNREDTPRLPDGSYDFECLEAIDLKYLNKFVDELLKTKKSKMPLFDFLTGTRKEKFVDVELGEKTVVIFEGIHALNPNLIKGHDDKMYKIYVCVNSNFDIGMDVVIPAKKLRMMRRLIRDYYFRGHSIETTLGLWTNVCRGEDKYIKPYKITANYLIDSTHMYEPLVYANYLPALLKRSESEEAAELAEMLKRCGKLKKDVVPSGSMLWEFLTKDN